MSFTGDYEYDYLYGKYPDTQEELIKYLENSLKINNEKILTMEEKIKEIKWKELTFEVFIVPKGTPRPRYSSGTGVMYVKGAKEIKKKLRKIVEGNGIICTRVNYYLDVYLPTPLSSMSNSEILLAEKGLIRPISVPDFDNLAKTYTDSLQGILLLNDNLINMGRVEKYFSIKPRIKIKIEYQEDFDSEFNRRKTVNSISYKKINEKVSG